MNLATIYTKKYGDRSTGALALAMDMMSESDMTPKTAVSHADAVRSVKVIYRLTPQETTDLARQLKELAARGEIPKPL